VLSGTYISAMCNKIGFLVGPSRFFLNFGLSFYKAWMCNKIGFLVGSSRFFLNFGLSFYKAWIGYRFESRDVSQVGLADVGLVETRLIFKLQGVLKAHSGSVVSIYNSFFSVAITNSGSIAL